MRRPLPARRTNRARFVTQLGGRLAVLHDYAAGQRDFDALSFVSADFKLQALAEISFRDANLLLAHFNHSVLTYADFSGSDLRDASFRGAKLTRALLVQARLFGARFDGASLTQSDLTLAQLGDPDARWPSSLAGADLTGARLISAVMTGVSLRGARLVRASLGSARLDKADLTDADLTGSVASSANFESTRMTNAILVRANLTGAKLDRADLGFRSRRRRGILDSKPAWRRLEPCRRAHSPTARHGVLRFADQAAFRPDRGGVLELSLVSTAARRSPNAEDFGKPRECAR